MITRSVEPGRWATLDKAKSGTAFISYLPQGRAMVCTHNRALIEEVAEMLGRFASDRRTKPSNESFGRGRPASARKRLTPSPQDLISSTLIFRPTISSRS